MQTMTQFIAKYSIRMDAERTDTNPDMDDSTQMDHWLCTMRSRKHSMRVHFSMGYGHNGKAPTAADVLDSLASDSASIENARDFADWASDFGYDADSRKAERTYRACERLARRLRRFLGSDDSYQALLFDTERL